MRRFTEHLAESADAHPYESERDRIVKAAFTAAKAAALEIDDETGTPRP